jgi:periplasmic mercuric ion binding protein
VHGKIINLLLVLAVLTVLGVLALAVRIRPAADSVSILETAGMTCNGCVADIEKALQQRKGVAAVEVNVEGGWVVVGYDSKNITPESIVSTVSGLGFKSRVHDLLSIEQFKAMTGRNMGTKIKTIGCAGGCGDGG